MTYRVKVRRKPGTKSEKRRVIVQLPPKLRAKQQRRKRRRFVYGGPEEVMRDTRDPERDAYADHAGAVLAGIEQTY